MSKARKPYHHGDLHEQLLNAGEQALDDLPLEKVTLREIARRAGVSHAAPKHHFPSLGHLMGEIAARGFGEFVVALGEAAAHAPDQAPEGRLLAMGKAYLRFAEANTAAYQMMFGQREPMVSTPNLNEKSREAWLQLVTAVSALVAPGQAEVGAVHVWSCVHGLATLKMAERMPLNLSWPSLEDRMLSMMITGLKS